MSTKDHRSIGEVLHVLEEEFPDVTISKIRFLESQGLLNPQRTPSGYRKFYEEDLQRLRWVLVQQRDNFLPLRVIKQRLDEGQWLPLDGSDTGSPSGSGDSPGGGGGNGHAPTAPTAAANGSLAPSATAPDPAGSTKAAGAGSATAESMAAPAPAGAASAAEPAVHPVAPRAATPASVAPVASPQRKPLDRGYTDREFTVNELAEAAQLEIGAIRELEKFGILQTVRDEPPIFDGEALVIAKAAAGFIGHGLEPRHLKAWRVAAEREAGTIEQMALPVSKQGSAGAQGRAVELANDLVGLGANLREALIRQSLRAGLQLD